VMQHSTARGADASASRRVSNSRATDSPEEVRSWRRLGSNVQSLSTNKSGCESPNDRPDRSHETVPLSNVGHRHHSHPPIGEFSFAYVEFVRTDAEVVSYKTFERQRPRIRWCRADDSTNAIARRERKVGTPGRMYHVPPRLLVWDLEDPRRRTRVEDRSTRSRCRGNPYVARTCRHYFPSARTSGLPIPMGNGW
jgi:hypothetical protein